MFGNCNPYENGELYFYNKMKYHWKILVSS